MIMRFTLKPLLITFFLATQLLLTAGVSQAQPYQVINTQSSAVGDDLSRTVTTIQSGANSIDRFAMTKVVKAGLPDEPIKGRHVDYMFSNKHAHELEHPILTWLLQNPFK